MSLRFFDGMSRLMNNLSDDFLIAFRSVIGNKRFFVIAGMALGIFAVLTYTSDTFLIYFGGTPYSKISRESVPISFLLASLASFALVYLQSGSDDNLSEIPEKIEIDRLLKEVEINKYRFTELKEDFSRLLSNQKFIRDSVFTDDERRELIDSITKNSGKDSIQEIFDERIDEVKENLKKQLNFEGIAASSRYMISRLEREISDLRLRSNINLVLGMAITVGGLYLLWTTVSIVDTSQLLKELASEGDESNNKFLKNLILPLVPRLSLIIFVEIFAYFFLRLYKEGLSEIKYFQNELTNAESKLVAVEFAFRAGSAEALKETIIVLSRTERNFVLEKGQTTVDLERAKSESELTKNIIKTIPNLFKKK